MNYKVIQKEAAAALVGAFLMVCVVSIPTAALPTKEAKPVETTKAISTVQTTKETTTQPTLTYWDEIPLKAHLQDYIARECEKVNISPTIVLAMIERESNFDKDAIGDNGESYGLMQIKKHYHMERMERLGCMELLDAYHNVRVGIDILAELVDEGDGIEWALMAFNGGRTYANEMAEHNKVSNYAKAVMARANELQK